MTYLADHADMFAPVVDSEPVVEPWKPRALTHEEWPPNYKGVYAWRINTLAELRANPELLASARAYYRAHKAEFTMHWVDTYNPRKKGMKWVPFVFFQRQLEFWQFLEELDRDQENGLVEKSRDMGATWEAAAYSVVNWLFEPDDATGWGSRKQELVDKLGDPDSIFEKMRLIVRRMPEIWLPPNFRARDHATFMKMTNPANGSTVTGESGDNIGRGGRKSRYFKDESAHYERPEKIEAALGDNTNVQIDISSVNGLGNVFHRRRESGIDWQPGKRIEAGATRVFVLDWRDHPEKTQEWYDARKAKAEREGMQHVFAQEVDRNYSAAVSNTIIPYEWLQACVDAHKRLECFKVDIPSVFMAGLDVADEGIDRNALALREWVILRRLEEWGERDTGVTTRRTVAALRGYKGVTVEYDSIGVGSGVKAEANRLVDQKLITAADLKFVAWNAGAAVVNPFERIIPDDEESLLNKDFFYNMKAQAWWSMRTRAYKTWRAVVHDEIYSAEELVSFDSVGLGALLHQLLKELAQPTRGTTTGLRTIVDKKPEGTKSPNLGDATVMAYFPAPDIGGAAHVGGYSG